MTGEWALRAHLRGAEWWARNRPGVVVDPGTTRHLDGVTTRCLLRGSCGSSCYCARTLWQLGRRPVEPVLAGELTGSEAWKASGTVTYVNEALVREEMAKGPVRVTLSPEVVASRSRSEAALRVRARYLRARADAEWREELLANGVPEELIGKAGAAVFDAAGETVYEHVVGPVHPYFHGPEHSEYFNQVTDPDAGTEPCG